MKLTSLLSLLIFGSLLSCKKNESEDKIAYWNSRKAQIESRVQNELLNLKSSASKIITSDTEFYYININKLSTYKSTQNSRYNSTAKINISQAIAEKKDLSLEHISLNKVMDTPVPPSDPTPGTPPLVAIYDINVYRQRYFNAIGSYIELSPFIILLNDLDNEVIINSHVNAFDKESFLIETAMLRAFATDVTNHQEFWTGILDYGPGDEIILPTGESTIVPYVQQVANQETGYLSKKQTVMGIPYRPGVRRGCRVTARDVLIGGVVGGFFGGASGAMGGGTIGSIIPGAGTIVGGVGGAVLGFAGGFISGAMTTAVAALLASCGR